MTFKTLSALALSALLFAPSAALACGGYGDWTIPIKNGPTQPAEKTSQPAPQPNAQPRPVDLVICLDVSGSMDGLIDSCRKKLWDICSLLAQARPTPKLRVALVTFGNGGHAQTGHVNIESTFTDELDLVYDKLMQLTTTGSNEYVGRVLHESMTKLPWSTDPSAMKMIFVAGNESADQDREFAFRAQVSKALQQSIVVNSIFCGTDATSGDAGTYREIASLGGGEYAAIDQSGTIAIATPFDAEITRLGQAINKTYLAFGRFGQARAENQKVQDANAEKVGAATLAARAQLKGSKALYCNSSWDLVDACEQKDFDWSKLKDEELPKELRGKSEAEIKAHVAKLKAEREAIQKQITALGKKRDAFIKAELAKLDNGKALDFAVAKAVKKAAEAKGFTFE